MLLAPLPAAGQGAARSWDAMSSPVFSHLGVAQGLPYPIVLSLAQDQQGFLWFGTPGGLARWDGYRMQVFRQDNSDPASLPENIIGSLLSDERGTLWVGSMSGLIARYDPQTGGFDTFRHLGSGLGRLLGLASDGNGGVWACGPFGLAHLDPATGTWQRFVNHDEVFSVLRDSTGTVWAGGAAGLMRRVPGGKRFERVATKSGADRLVITALFQDRAGTVWFGTATGQLGSINSNGVPRLVKALEASTQRVTSIVEPLPGTLWISEFGGGIREFKTGARTVRGFRHAAAIPGTIADDTLSGMLVDRSGLVWVGGVGGVDFYNPRNSGVTTILPDDPSEPLKGLPGKHVRSMAVRSDGKVWLGSRGDGLVLLDPEAGRVAAVQPGLTDGFPKLLVQALAAPGGDVWAGLTRGLYRVDGATGTTTQFEALGTANIRALMAEPPWLWAGGSMGLARIDLRDGTMHVYRNDPNQADSLTDNSVQSLLRDRQGRLWVGTLHGLNLLDPATDSFRRILHNPRNRFSLPNDIINALAQDGSDRIWAATGNGIGIIDPQTFRIRQLGTTDGLPHDTVTMLLEDDSGTMWAATGDGLAAIDPRTLAVRTLGPADGVGIRTTWAGSGARMPDGALLFGGIGGLTVIRPGQFPRWDFQAPVVTTAVRVDGYQVQPRDTVTLAPENRGLEVEFSALDYSWPENNRYAYQLEGFDQDWVTANSTQRKATYTNLPPGRYVLAIRGSNRHGSWSEPPLRLAVVVLPAWHQTTWFHVLAGLTALLLVAGLIQGRTAYLRRRQRDLEWQVARRTEELEAARTVAITREDEAHRAREQAEAADQAKSRFLAVASHEIRTPLNGLLGMLQLLEPHHLPPEERNYLEIARRSGTSLISLIDSILEYGRHEVDSEAAEVRDFDPRQLAREAVELLRPQAIANSVLVELQMAPEVPAMVRCDQVRLTRILHNLLGNAIKFTPRGMVEVSVGFAAGTPPLLRLSVSDTGIGIAPELREAIFKDFVQADDTIARQFGGTGLGLAICRRAAALMNGSLTVDSAPGAGSVFELTVPVEIAAVTAEPAAAPVDGASLTLLLVDDDEINQEVGLGLLRRLGHTVTVVGDGPSAVTAAAAQDFDAVLMDLHMPGLDGIGTCRHIRALANAHRANVRIIVVSAGFTRAARDSLAELGVDRLVTKPLHADALRQALTPLPGITATAARPNPGDGLVNTAFLANQWEILGTADLVRLGRLFHRSSRITVAQLDGATAAGDRATVRALAHRLGSSAGALGLTRLAAQARATEMRAETATAEELAGMVADIRRLRRESMEALTALARENLSAAGA